TWRGSHPPLDRLLKSCIRRSRSTGSSGENGALAHLTFSVSLQHRWPRGENILRASSTERHGPWCPWIRLRFDVPSSVLPWIKPCAGNLGLAHLVTVQ